MPTAEEIARVTLATLREQVFDVTPAIRQGNAGQVIGATYNKVGDVQGRLSAVDRLLGALAERDAVAIAGAMTDPAALERLAQVATARAGELRRPAGK